MYQWRGTQLAYCFFLYCTEEIRGIGGGSGKPGITVDVGEGVTQTSASSLARSGITAIYYKARCVVGWSAPEETHLRQHLGLVFLSPSHLWLTLVIVMEPNSPKKIQFAVPLFQSQIAPEAAEQVSGIGWGPVIQIYIFVINWKLFYHLHLLLWLSRICG